MKSLLKSFVTKCWMQTHPSSCLNVLFERRQLERTDNEARREQILIAFTFKEQQFIN